MTRTPRTRRARRALTALALLVCASSAVLGTPSTTSAAPTTAQVVTRWSGVSTAQAATCAVRADASLWCWGSNAQHQFGDGTTSRSLVPRRVSTGPWAGVDMGPFGGCGIRQDASLWCWGYGGDGANGDGTFDDAPLPVQVAPGTSWVAVARDLDTCGVQAGGSLWCWGPDVDGSLGVGGSGASTVPVRVGDPAVVWRGVSTAGYHACAVQGGGSLWCWGDGEHGATGVGDTLPRTVPTRVGTASTWERVSTGNSHTCALRQGTRLWCWGSDSDGQLGNGAPTADVLVPQRTAAGTQWQDVTTGPFNTCGIRRDGAAWCWGEGFYGVIGDGGGLQDRARPVRVSSSADWREQAMSLGGQHVCAVQTNSTAWCWGWRSGGRLGDGTDASYQPDKARTPVPVAYVR